MTEQEGFTPMHCNDSEIQRSNSITHMSTDEADESSQPGQPSQPSQPVELEKNLLVEENYENKLIYYIKTNVNIDK